jgi:hypothetical protein
MLRHLHHQRAACGAADQQQNYVQRLHSSNKPFLPSLTLGEHLRFRVAVEWKLTLGRVAA